MNRQTKNGICLDSNEDSTTQRLDAIDALKAVTINAAYQYFEEKEKGSLVVGKKADFIIVDQNPFTIEDQIKNGKLKNICVLQTYKDGICLYKREKEEL